MTRPDGAYVAAAVGLAHEQRPNPYITPGLCLEFHYFFMRELWFAHLARAFVGLATHRCRRYRARCSRTLAAI